MIGWLVNIIYNRGWLDMRTKPVFVPAQGSKDCQRRTEQLLRFINLRAPWVIVADSAWNVFIDANRLSAYDSGKPISGWRFWFHLFWYRWLLGPGAMLNSWTFYFWHCTILRKKGHQIAALLFPDDEELQSEWLEMMRSHLVK